jgi:2-methylcitrate dehydratase PrpD
LARDGYTGPETILDGKFGFLDAFCRSSNSVPLTADLGKKWETLGVSLKRYAAHVYAQIPMQLLRELMAANTFAGGDVKKIIIEGGEKLLSHHNILEPKDILKGQYSVPFCTGLALYRDPDDPNSFNADAIADGNIQSATRKVELRVREQHGRAAWSAHMTVQLHDGREFSKEGATYKGMPGAPFGSDDLRRKFMLLTSKYPAADAENIFAVLQTLEAQSIFSMQQ